MRVLDHEPSTWFLLQDEDDLYVDGHYNHSFMGYSHLIKLNTAEVASFRAEGRAAITRLVETIQYSCPLKLEASPYRTRKASREVSDRVHTAIMAWRAANNLG